MKIVFAALACSALLATGSAWAQTGQTFNDNTGHGSTMNPKPPAGHTTTAAPARTVRTGQPVHHIAAQEKCRKAPDDKDVPPGQARTDYLRRCPNKVAPR